MTTRMVIISSGVCRFRKKHVSTGAPPFTNIHTALRCTFLVALHHGVQLTPEELNTANGTDDLGAILKLLNSASIKAKALHKRRWEDVAALGTAYPALARMKEGNWVIVIYATTDAQGQAVITILDPVRDQGPRLYQKQEFLDEWAGTLIVAKRVYTLTDESQPFGFRWFMPEIIRHAAYFRGVATAAVMSTLISFSIPLLFQVLLDKVISHQNYNTLYVLLLVFVIIVIFDCCFMYVRQRLMLFASIKIDARLSSRTFQHLLSLPLPFFEKNTAGVLSRHMQQTEKLRQFLTGRLFQVLLDAATLPLLLVGLFIYSAELTSLVLLFSLMMAAVIGFMVPTFRRVLNQLYQAEGARQAHLVETIHGMRTVKSLALEPERQKTWDSRLAFSAQCLGEVGRIGALGSMLTSGLEKLMMVTVLTLGVTEVFDGTLTIGSLVAFNMLAGRVTGPLVQIVALINEYQEAALSVRMLGTVMNTPPERGSGERLSLPPITGAMEFQDVTFTYDGAAMPALNRVSFKVEEGQIIGIVGRSGSGKTTITRMIQGIHTPQSGLIRLNGTDIRHIDLSHLRRSTGVVLQDNMLFRGTIRENIAVSRPTASLQEVLEAARMAGADEFIDRLPRSYDTMVEENATNFSGGQRQRIAIARALLTHPRLLIFDEATSALDPESEAIVQENLTEIARGRTMVVVSHRLSSLVRADAILVLEHGSIVDFAPHSVLVGRCDVYRHLWQQQTQYLQ